MFFSMKTVFAAPALDMYMQEQFDAYSVEQSVLASTEISAPDRMNLWLQDEKKISTWIEQLPEEHKDSDRFFVMPRYGLIAPVLIPLSNDREAIDNGESIDALSYLERWVFHHFGTLPEDWIGNTVLAWHTSFSKNSPWSFKTIFQPLLVSDIGDQFRYINKNKENHTWDRYIYEISIMDIVDFDDAAYWMTQRVSSPTITTYGCYPLGTTERRKVVQSVLISQDSQSLERVHFAAQEDILHDKDLQIWVISPISNNQIEKEEHIEEEMSSHNSYESDENDIYNGLEEKSSVDHMIQISKKEESIERISLPPSNTKISQISTHIKEPIIVWNENLIANPERIGVYSWAHIEENSKIYHWDLDVVYTWEAIYKYHWSAESKNNIYDEQIEITQDFSIQKDTKKHWLTSNRYSLSNLDVSQKRLLLVRLEMIVETLDQQEITALKIKLKENQEFRDVLWTWLIGER